MEVDNIRLGFATNSSSSHSIIFGNKSKVLDEYNPKEFGWDFFTLASKEAKKEYFATMIKENLYPMPTNLINLLLKGMDLPSVSNDDYIDHKSMYYLPKEYGMDFVSVEFMNDFQKYLLRDDVLILGGNDNDDENHPLCTTNRLIMDRYYPDYRGWIGRKDGDWWILYNKDIGNRAIFSFEDEPNDLKLESPLLLDLKITDFCDKGCSFCYMDSSSEGQHIDHNNIYRVLSNIAHSKVFEVAIGGGEPTKCPDFKDIIVSLYHQGVKPNFSTASLDWMDDLQLVETIMPLVGAFAYSVNCVQDVTNLLAKCKDRSINKNKISVQIIPDTISEEVLEEILLTCAKNYIRVTLLGFKEVGRGKSAERTGTENKWLECLSGLHKRGYYTTVSIDTTLAARCKGKMEEQEISEYLYHTEEGIYSAYIDGVAMKYGPSSFEPDKLVTYDPYKKRGIVDLFDTSTQK